ncbi:leucine-rich PPR motif-containing protein, mitochondrial [Episyrphus balteatus]|uniref:leucine-rich PPR motif-containing protein, mitochondrial n=1 Tax=Episyrphus balteatus TaxID=286459 RepID=UPI0024860937|nr:leucine-rich PPR motif-containing protein, mitochondrial [Episyrphus balteatus]
MNFSILESFWRLSSLNSYRKLSQIKVRGYAIQTNKNSWSNVLLQTQRNYVIRPVINENLTLLEQALSKLQSDFAHLGYVNPGNFRRMLESLEAGGSLTTEDSIFLLNSCGPELMPSQTPQNRMELFTKLWEYLKKNDALQKDHYKSFLKVHAENGFVIENFREFLEEKQLTENPEMYEKLIQFACRIGDIKLATDILVDMKAKGLPLTENVFNALIMGHAKNKDLPSALVVLETMKAARVEPSSSTFTQLIIAYIKNGNMDKAIDLFLIHSQRFNAQKIIKIIRELTVNEQGKTNREFMALLVRELPAEYLNAKEVPSPIRNLCTELIHSGHVDEAYVVMDCLPCPKFNDDQDIDTYGYIFLQDLFRGKVNSEKIIEIANELIASGKNSRALHVACDSAMHRNPDLGYLFLKALSEKEHLRPHYFWPLFLHRFRSNGEAGIIKVVKMMSELKVECDFETLSFYVLPKLSVTLENAQQAIKTLEACGLRTSQSLNPLIVQLIAQQKLEEVMKIAQLYTSKLETKLFVQPLAHLAVRIRATRRFQKYTNTIHTLFLKSNDPKIDFVGLVLIELIIHKKLRDDVRMLERIISDVSRLGTKISPAAAEALNTHFIKIKTDETDIPNIRQLLATMTDRKLTLKSSENSNSNIVHPRDMSYEELECHLLELEAKNMNTRGVLRRLLQICVRDNKLKRALEVKNKCDIAKVELSPGMMASILDMYIKLDDFSSAQLSLQQLQKTFPGFLLDEHKLLDFAALTVKQNELEKAKQILMERAASRKVFGGDYVIKNVWNLLTNVAQLAAKQTDLPKETNITKEMFFFVRKLGFCNAHNAVLGPIIREYILRKDIRSAVAEFKTLAETFRHTPLQFELSSLLVRLSNGKHKENFNVSKEEAKELLQDLTRTASSIHGQVNMNSSLLLAVAESGTENQLRKLLINPEFRLNHEMLAQNCEHLNKEGSVYTLMRLAKACRGLGHVIKEHDVYNMLLMKFVNENNCAASLELFEKLEADDEFKMSQEFLRTLVNLLKVNKLDIPSSLALRAQVT